MEQIKLEVQLRNEAGSVDVKNLRKAGFIPGVVYGGKEKPVSIKLMRKDFDRVLRHHGGESSLYEVNVQDNGTTISVVDGPVLVASLSAPNSTLKYITLESGQQLFIPHNQTQAAVQDLNSSIVEFTPASSGGGATLIIVIFIVALAAGYWLRRRGKKNAAEDKEDRSVVKDKKPSRKTRA